MAKQIIDKKTKPYWEMNTAELREATKEFDEPNAADKFGPPNAAQRKQLKEMGIPYRPLGRPKVGAGAKRVLLTVERNLLAQADKVAKKRKMSRSQFVAEGLRLAMKAGNRRKAG